MERYTNFNPTEFNTYTKRKGKQNIECSDDILTLDIEVSSAWIENGVPIPYRPFETEDFWNSKKSVSLCYIWQFSFNGTVYYGRDFIEFRKVLFKLPRDIHFVIWVHNLGYEFEFLCNLYTWSSVFARSSHSPMKAIPDELPNIEFRCSYILTRLALESWGKELNIPKLTGYLDYNKLRTPNTPLTEGEMAYSERDCVIVDAGIRQYLKKYKHIHDIPLTQTGEVRRVVKKLINSNKSEQAHMVKLLPENAYMYSVMKQTFMGGYTHANAYWSGRTVRRETGYAYDFASSYPAVMCSEMFPYTPFQKSTFDFDMIDKYAYLLRVEFKNVKAKLQNHYLPFAKCLSITADRRVDNGRVVSCSRCEMWITEQDLDIILKAYECEYEVIECYRSRKAYLPVELVSYVLELYNNKTQYKGVEGKEEIYKQSKEFINSLFGMCVTDLIQDSVAYMDGGVWTKELKSMADVEEYLLKLQTENKGKTFLAYQFGIWITAYARHNLWECLIYADTDVIYSDTDSLKLAEKHNFDWYNEKIESKIHKCLDTYNIDRNMASPKDPKGIPHPLGHFDEEDPWTEFKTLGAKRYCYRSKKDGELHLTVSGISKNAVVVLDDDIENFNENTVFDKDYYESYKETGGKDGTKRMHIYHQQEPTVWKKGEPDEFSSEYFQGIAIRPTSYSMSISEEYYDLLHTIMNTSTNHLQAV